MKDEILVSKITGSPNELAWAQASSTGKLYIVIGLSSEEDKSIAAKGKETLEQLQREFFALDEKKLSNIKGAVEKVFSSLDQDIKYSAVVASITNDILYIVTVSDGVVVINRKDNLAEVARGEEGKIIGFSGRIKNNDIIVIETNEFNRKISNKLLAEYTGTPDHQKIAEDITPFILEDSKGQEAAVIIQYNSGKESEESEAATTPTGKSEESQSESIREPEEKEEYAEEEPAHPEEDRGKKSSISPLGFLSNFKNPISKFSKKQKRIFIIAVIIVVLLVGSLIAERYMEAQKVQTEEFNAVYEESNEGFENAQGLASVNRGRALEETNQAIQNIEENLDKFSEESDEYEQLSSLLAELQTLRDELGGGSEVAGNVIFEAGNSEILDNIDQISYSNGNLVVTGNDGYAIINEEGEIDSEQELDDLDFRDSISDDTYLYLLGDSVTRVTLSNGSEDEIIEGSGDNIDISYFGTNVYLLESGGEVTRYSGSSYQGADYFSEDISLTENATSFAIDSSIYVLAENGALNKYTRGENDDDFELDESVKTSENALLYSNEELDHFYILDIDNATITQITPEGSVNNKFNSLDLQNASSFTVNADESAVFVVIDNQVYSYDL